MAYFNISNFRYGFDSRRSELSAQPGTLLQCENAHITQGGEVEKRKAFVRSGLTPLRTIAGNEVLSILGATVDNYYRLRGVANTGILQLSDIGKNIYDNSAKLIGTIIAIDTTTLESNGKYRVGFFYSKSNQWVAAGQSFTIYDAMFGLQSTESGLLVFGSGPTPTGLPAYVSYQQLVNPINSSWSMFDVVTSTNFGGKSWVVAKYFDPNNYVFPDTFENVSFVFYNGIALGEWWEGYLITQSSFMSRMRTLLSEISGFYVSALTYANSQTAGVLVVGQEYTITTYNAGDSFTNVGAASNAAGVTFIATGTTPTTWTHSSQLTSGKAFNVWSDYGISFSVLAGSVVGSTVLTAAKTASAVTPVAGFGAAGQLKLTGGSGGNAVTITGFTAGASTVYAAANHSFAVGDWVQVSGFINNPTLNVPQKVTAISAGVSFTTAFNSTGFATETGTCWKSGGILRLTVTPSGGSAFDLIDTASGTVPIMMPITSGDVVADVTSFVSYITALINETGGDYTAKNREGMISLYADPALGPAGNDAVIRIVTVNDLTTDTASFAVTTTAAADTCQKVYVDSSTMNLLTGTTGTASIVSATASQLDMAQQIAAAIQSHRDVTGYTAAVVTLVDTTVTPNPVSYNVVISKTDRTSADAVVTNFNVQFNGSGIVAVGGYVGNAIFYNQLKATALDVTQVGSGNSGSFTVIVLPHYSGGVAPYSFGSVAAVDLSALTVYNTGGAGVSDYWNNTTGAGSVYTITYGANAGSLTFSFTAKIKTGQQANGTPIYSAGKLRGWVKYTIAIKDSVGAYTELAGNIFFT